MAGTVLYYFSATGNSWYVAQQIAEQIPGCVVKPMASAEVCEECQAVGFVMPVYAGGLPLLARRFLEEFAFSGGLYYFAVVTYGMWPGRALAQVSDLLEHRGVRLSYARAVKSVENNIFAFRVPKEDKIQTILLDSDEKARRIARDVTERKYRPAGRAILPPKSYYEKTVAAYPGRDKEFVVDQSCTRCGQCGDVCPVGNITVSEDGVEFHHHCESCFACVHWCPRAAIQVGDKTRGKERYHEPRCTASLIQRQKKLE